MSLITIVLVFMMAIVVTVFVSHLLPVKVPLPLIQIAAGLRWPPADFRSISIRISFAAVYSAAAFPRWLADPQRRLFQGYEADSVAGDRPGDGDDPRHWSVYTLADPAITVAAGFALAAILSPTDPVAVSAMTASSPLPSRMAHILEGESLLNDASGLVAFNFAIAAVLTGSFSPGDAVVKFS